MTVIQRFARSTHDLALKTIRILAIIVAGILTISTFVFSYYAEDMDSQISLFHFDNPLLSLFSILLVCFLLSGLFRLSENKLCKVCNFLIWFVPVYCVFGGLLLVIFGRTLPMSDAYSVYAIGESFATGNLEAIQPTGNTYLSFYPQQIGLIAYYEIVCRLWNLLPFSAPAYHILKCGNVLFAALIIIYQYRIVHILADNVKADITYLLLAICNVPLVFYTSFVYGEIPSFAFACMGMFYLLQADKHVEGDRLHISGLVLSAITLILSVLLRKNSIILVIAVFIAVFCRFLYTKRRSFCVYAIVMILLSVNILPITQAIYEYRTGSYLLPGVPATSYFAMAMQESSRGNGWYNGFNFYTYQETGLDTDATVEISKQAISERLTTFQNDIPYALQFYAEKFLSQWTDGTYACRQATIQTYGNRAGFLESMYTGTLAKSFAKFCNIYQLLIYLGTLLFFLANRKALEPQWSLLLYMGIIGVIGGLLFHTIWEANSRYILPYGFLLIPYAAIGLPSFIDKNRG